MKNEIQKLSKIVDWMYENSPEGVEILYVEEAFDRLYRCIENLEMSEEEEFEFRCLEYEYELNYFYKFIHPESQMAEVINYILGSLNGILFQANLHQRIKKLTERIFIVGIKAAEEQALELMNLKIIPNQLAWLWEAYAEEYVKKGENLGKRFNITGMQWIFTYLLLKMKMRMSRRGFFMMEVVSYIYQILFIESIIKQQSNVIAGKSA